jgi:hypothetical protein
LEDVGGPIKATRGPGCDVAILREAFSRHATARQRRAIVERIEFAFLGDTGRELTG